MNKTSQSVSSTDDKAYQQLGESYVKIPRSMMDLIYHADEWQRKIGCFYVYLYLRCAFQPHTVRLGKYTVRCRRGEFAGSYRSMAKATGITLSCVRRILKELSDKELIRIEQVPGGSRIYLYGYDRYNSKAPTARNPDKERALGWAEYEERMEKGQVWILNGEGSSKK